jgi:3'-phosphoadenosine 5'-phosphosulfate sulfotransferase (PAPS reductase)/FAD synthetase
MSTMTAEGLTLVPDTVDLREYDVILVNSSGGKDSQTMLRYVALLAAQQGVLDRVTVVHSDLGRVEWEGTRELARLQAEFYGLRFIVTERTQNDLLDHVLALHADRQAKGKDTVPWPDSNNRWCTSDHKRGPVRRVMTQLVKELGLNRKDRPAKLLNCMGLRAEESPKRAKKVPFTYDQSASGKGVVRQVWEWLPIHDWTEVEVWADIHASGVPYHRAYDLGMPRLSCCFCIFSGRDGLVLAAQHNPELAQRYHEIEVRTGYTMKQDLPFSEIIEAAKTETIERVAHWHDC